MTSTTDPLARLVVDQREVDRELLATTLGHHVAVDPKRGSFAYRRGAKDKLTNAQLMLVSLLAQKALTLLGAEVSEELSPKDLEGLTGMKGNSIRPALKQLTDAGVTQRVESGGYVVPGYALADAADMLPSGQGEGA